MSLPPPADDYPVEILSAASPAEVALAEAVANTRRLRRRPQNVPQNVWDIAQDLADNGGLFDMTIPIARLEAEWERLELDAQDSVVDGKIKRLGLTVAEHAALRLRLAEKLVKAKLDAASLAVKTREIVTVSAFMLMLETTRGILQRRIPEDPHLVEQIGQDVGDAFTAVLRQMRRNE